MNSVRNNSGRGRVTRVIALELMIVVSWRVARLVMIMRTRQ